MMRLHSFLTGFFAIFQVLLTTGEALKAWNVTGDDFARARWQSSIIVDNWLYIEGGELYEVAADQDTLYPPTLSIDLSISWTTSSVVINQISKPAGISGRSSYRRPGLFWQPTTKSIVLYGGTAYSDSDQQTIWGFSPGSPANGDGKWPPAGAKLDNITWPQGPSTVDTTSGGFAVGGFSYAAVMRNLLNMTIIGNNTYTASTDIGPYASSGVQNGGAHFVPSFGTGRGLVIYLGGLKLEGRGEVIPMSTINVYDIASKQWYTQTAGGDVPSGRTEFCVTGAQGTNISTYEIFLYGGAGPTTSDPASSDSRVVYILTLPAFRWIRTSQLFPPRAAHTCQVVKSQLLSYGGWDPVGDDNVDLWKRGLQIFDMTKLTWSERFNTTADAYVQSRLVDNFYATNPYTPTWDTPSILALFVKPTAVTSPNSPTTPPATQKTTTSPSSAPSNPSQSSKVTVAPIAGGTIGGVALLAGLLTLLWLFVIRPRRMRNRIASTTPYDQIPKSELHDSENPAEIGGAERPHEMESKHTHEMETKHVQELETKHIQELYTEQMHEMDTQQIYEMPTHNDAQYQHAPVETTPGSSKDTGIGNGTDRH